jgi:hypothetical protein
MPETSIGLFGLSVVNYTTRAVLSATYKGQLLRVTSEVVNGEIRVITMLQVDVQAVHSAD